MAHFNKEKRLEQFHKLSSVLAETLNSPESVNMVLAIAEKNHFEEGRSKNLVATVAYLLLGLTHPEDLEKEIVENVQIDPRIAKEVAREINIKVILPVAAELNRVHGFHIALPAQPAPPPQSPPQNTPELEQKLEAPIPQPKPQPEVVEKEVIIKPRVVKEDEASQLAAPVVLHEHEEREVVSEDVTYGGGLVRPSFYSPSGTSEPEPESTTAAPPARLEIGRASEVNIEPQTTKVGRESASVVHYTAPETPADPFAAQQPSKPALQTSPKPKVDPKNVVDLKDLPQ